MMTNAILVGPILSIQQSNRKKVSIDDFFGPTQKLREHRADCHQRERHIVHTLESIAYRKVEERKTAQMPAEDEEMRKQKKQTIWMCVCVDTEVNCLVLGDFVLSFEKRKRPEEVTQLQAAGLTATLSDTRELDFIACAHAQLERHTK